MTFADHFSTGSKDYAAHRPTYPEELYRWIVQRCPERNAVWDCATGNGQAAIALTRWFTTVYATDASQNQIEAATAIPNVQFSVADAFSSGLQDACTDLVTVAQAAHWFAGERFAAEVRRVLRPHGIAAIWCYGLMSIRPDIDDVVSSFYTETVGPFWPPERHWVDQAYRGLPTPITNPEQATFTMERDWHVSDCLSYIETWSAAKRFTAANDHSPMEALAAQLHDLWGSQRLCVSWPVSVTAGPVR